MIAPARNFVLLAAIIAILLAGGQSRTHAQSQAHDGQIDGVVTDVNGASVPSARVTAVNLDTGAVRTTTTGEDGFFRFPLLTLGSYSVTAERSGFKPFERRGVQLTGSRTATVNMTIEAGTPDERVTVTADTAIADESKLEIGRNVSSREVNNLPLVSRNPYNFILLQPGTSGRSQTGLPVVLLNSGGLARRVGNHLDGAFINDIDVPGFRLTFVSEVYVKEIQLLSRGYSAEFGNTSGVVVNIITPSGTNRHTGNAALLYRPSRLASRAFGTSTPDNSSLGFTASIGGPIVKDRWHYYFGYERMVQRSLPDITVLPADRAALVAAGVPDSIFVNSKDTVDLVPYLIFRSDLRLSESSRVNFRYNRFAGPLKYAGAGGITTTDRSFDRGGYEHGFAAQAVTTFSDTFFNEVRFLYAKRVATINRNDLSGTGPSILVRSNVNIAAFGPSTSIGAVDTDQSTSQFLDTVTKVFSRHSIKVGGGFNLIHDATIDGLVSLYEFPTILAYRNAVNGTNPRGYTRYTETFGERRRPMDVLFVNAFIQDDFRVSRRIKLNLGLRYELYRPPKATVDSPLAMSQRFRTDKNNFAFRLGATYLLNDGRFRTVVRAGSGIHYDPLQLRHYRRARLNNGDPQFFSFTFGSGDFGAPDFPNRLRTFPPGTSIPPRVVDAVSPDFTTMYAINSNVQIETALTNDLSISAGYLHTAARHIPVTFNINCLPTGETLADGRPVYGTISIAANGNATRQACVNKLYPRFSQVMMVESAGNLGYHGTFVQLAKRFSGGLQASANYTFSNARDDAPEDVPGFGGLRQTDPSNRARDRGASFGDVRHIFRMSLVAQPRFGFSDGKMRVLFNGFQFGVIALADSGEAFNISTNFDLNRDGVDGDRAVGISRNSGRIPGFFVLDARFSRRFKLRETFVVEVYGEAANLFNIKSVASYTTTVLSAGNVNTSLVDPRTGQLTGDLPDFSAGLTNWRPARAVQLGLKVHF